MQKKIILGLLLPFIIIVAAGVVIFYFVHKPSGQAVDISTTQSTSTSKSISTVSANQLPVPLNDPSIQSVYPEYSPTLIRYAFTGVISQLILQQDGSTLLSLRNETSAVPPIVIQTSTRISKINVDKSLITLTLKDLKPALVVDISMDYEKNQKVWYLRDIYVPADRNLK